VTNSRSSLASVWLSKLKKITLTIGLSLLWHDFRGASMTEAIWVALIGAVAVILAAVLPPIVRALLPKRVAQRLEDAEKNTEDAISRAGGASGDDAIFQRKLFLTLGLGEIAVGLLFYLTTSIGMTADSRFALFILLFFCSLCWLAALITFGRVYFAGFIEYGLWPGALSNVVAIIYFWIAAIVAANVNSLPAVWTTPFYILLVIHHFASRRDALILRRYHREFWDARLK